MSEGRSSTIQAFNQQSRTDESQKCFVGHSLEAQWTADLKDACNQILPEFRLKPWYAAEHFDPTKPLREKVVELIAKTRYGIYDLSYWRKDNRSEWIMPRNVFIELGTAIALNRPTLLLRHASNRDSSVQLPKCLEGVSPYILEFAGAHSLRDVLRKGLSQWKGRRPEQDWWNRYCTFGERVCKYREAHPHMQQWGQKTLHCHISDGKDTDRLDFREVVEEVLGRFDEISFDYLDALSVSDGYDFLLCTYCQTVRSTPFAIYRITPQTPAETFIAIGMSLALEAQFAHTIPKILLTGYEVIIARNDQESMTFLRERVPIVIQQVRKATWKPKPLPFIEIIPKPPTPPPTEAGKADRSTKTAPRKRIAASQVTGVLRQAQTFQTQGRFNDAIDLCEQILESGFDRPDARYFLGWLYQKQQRWDEAIQQFQMLLNDPDYALSCYYGLGQCYRARGDLQTASTHFDEAVDRVNLDALTLEEADQLIQLCQEAAEVHRQLGKAEQALTLYNALLGFLRSRGWVDKVAQVEIMLSPSSESSGGDRTATTTNSDKMQEAIGKSASIDLNRGEPHVLLFERDQQLKALLTSEFQLAGYEFHTAHTAVEVFDAIARYPVRLVLVNLAQAAAGRREFWVALDAQRRGRGLQVLTFRCMNLAGYGPMDPDDRGRTVVADIEVDGMLGVMNLVDAVGARIPGSTNRSPANDPISPSMHQSISSSATATALNNLPDWLTGLLNDADKAQIANKQSAQPASLSTSAPQEASTSPSPMHISPTPGQPSMSLNTNAASRGHQGILRVEKGKNPGQLYEVRKAFFSIGRSRDSDIFLEDLAVSRLHASVLHLGNGNYALRDEGSANGTSLNGIIVNKYQPYPLQEGDRIELGQTVLVFAKR